MGCMETKSKQTAAYSPFQEQVMQNLSTAYSPYIGAGTLGGLSDLETSALNMLKGANVWGPLSAAGTGLLTGTTGAQPITKESAAQAFKGSVEDPVWFNWQDKLRPMIKEEYAGPGYWGSARPDAVREGATDIARALGTERANWMWDVEQANRAIEEAKAGRALSALGAVPASMLSWTGGISSMGRNEREILNSITDPQVLSVLQSILGTSPQGERKTESPYGLKDYLSMGSDFARIMSGLP